MKGLAVKTNFFSGIPQDLQQEIFETVLQRPGLRIERILSKGHSSPPGFWYDQEENEWVMILKGSAALLFEDASDAEILGPGDCLDIPAHRKHRVEWTDASEETIWIAAFYK